MTCFFSKPGTLNEPQIATAEDALATFYSSGYPLSVEQAAAAAKKHLDETLLQKPSNPILVCDIDDTALSSWPLLSAEKFAPTRSTFEKYFKAKKAEPLLPVLRLYEYAINQGVKVVFLSYRPEELRAATETNLKIAGFKGPHIVILKAKSETLKLSQFKLAQREKLQREGGTIVINIGDQLTDLDLPPSPNDFLIPNPFYREH